MFEENEIVNPRLQGYRAFFDGCDLNLNPYIDAGSDTDLSDAFYEWTEGWYEAEQEYIHGECDEDFCWFE